MTTSDSLKVLLRVAAEIFNRSYRVRKYFEQIGPGETGEHKQITNALQTGFNNVEEVVRDKFAIFSSVAESDKAQVINGLYDDLKRFSRWFIKLHSLLSYLPRQPVTPETVYSLESSFDKFYTELSPSIILGNVANAYEYDFFKVLESQIEDLHDIVLDDSENIVLQLAICDRESPPAWAILAHEMGHAIDDKRNISSNVTSEFVTDVDSYPFDRVRRWCCELCADLIAAEVLGPAPILSVLSLEYCWLPQRSTFDICNLNLSHPPTRWRIEAVSNWLKDRHGWDVLKNEREFLELIWQFSYERAYPNESERRQMLEDEKEAYDILLKGLVGKLTPKIRDLELPSLKLSKGSIDRCVDRLTKNCPIGAQGIKREELLKKIGDHRVQIECLPMDNDGLLEKARLFKDLKSRFRENPMNSATIFYSGHLARQELLSLNENDISTLTSKDSVAILCQKLSRIDALSAISIRCSSVHNRLLSLIKSDMPNNLYEEVDTANNAKSASRSRLGLESGVLSDIEILERLVAPDEKCIFVSPLIDPGAQLGASSLDLRLGTELRVIKSVASTHIDLTASKREFKRQRESYFEELRVPANGSFVLHPGEFALAPTLEFIRLPIDIAGRLEGRSTLGRIGLQVHATAGFVDPGFEGSLTFELINSGRLPIKIAPGYRLGQICFFYVRDVQIPYGLKDYSKYSGKLGVELSQAQLDPEIPVDNTK